MDKASSPAGPRFVWLLGWLAMAWLIIAVGIRGRSDSPGSDLLPASSDSASPTLATADRQSALFATTIRRPSGPPAIAVQQADPQGRIGSVACSTCHSVREPNYANRTPADLDQFHQNMPLAHGTLACYSCHNASDTDTLSLADSTPVEYADVMTLCAQCHGSQARDYAHGAHGGMSGHWDLSRGPRIRNNCIDCHDPHVPKFPQMQPTFKPRDRFLDPPVPHSSSNDSLHSEFDRE